MSKDRYIYKALPSQSAIRLLRVHSARHVSLHIVDSLNESPPYDALSYTWGNPQSKYSASYLESHESGAPCIPITCDNGMIYVTSNLSDALGMLLKTPTSDPDHSCSYVWIDAICIDQSNIDERGKQVTLMGDLYRKARNVYAWIGQEDEHTADAFTTVDRLSSIPPHLHKTFESREFFTRDILTTRLGLQPPSPSNWLGWIAFLHRPYFQRIWIVQEVSLAVNVILVCGSIRRSWDTFSLAIRFLLRSGWHVHLRMQSLRLLYANAHEETPGYDKLRSAFINPGYNAIFLELTKNEAPGPEHIFDVDHLLEAHRQCLASDPRDKVYALSGMFTEDLQAFMSSFSVAFPDYNISVQTLYTRMTLYVLQSDGNLGFLSQVEVRPDRTEVSDLPSWVPDFSVGKSPVDLYNKGGRHRWAAATGLAGRLDISSIDQRTLHLKGICIGQVEDSIIWDGTRDQWWNGIARILLGLPKVYSASQQPHQTRIDAIWRTLIADTYQSESPAPESCSEQFIAYISFMYDNLATSKSLSKFPWLSHRCEDPTLQGHHSPESLAFRDLEAQIGSIDFSDRSDTDPDSTVTLWRRLFAQEPYDSKYGFEQCQDATNVWNDIYVNGNIHDRGNRKGFYARYFTEMTRMFEAHTVFRTGTQLICLGPDTTRKGDEVWVLAGGFTPFVLRRTKGQDKKYQFLGEAYVHGMMHGEAMELGLDTMDVILE